LIQSIAFAILASGAAAYIGSAVSEAGKYWISAIDQEYAGYFAGLGSANRGRTLIGFE